jgi:hypothetical protein
LIRGLSAVSHRAVLSLNEIHSSFAIRTNLFAGPLGSTP